MARDSLTLTKADMETIRLALNYGAVERRSFLEAISGCGMDAVQTRNEKLVDRFEKLHIKLFGEATNDTLQRKRDQETPTVSIFDLARNS